MNFKEKLIELNKRGLIHAPDESDDSFFLRCRRASHSSSSPASPLAKKMFDIEPDWVWMIYDNKGLRFWEGACTWTKRDQFTLQLNKAFQQNNSYLGYSRDEVIAHELVHAVRGNFEEILAYQASSSTFRRFCAPIFRTARESLFFMVSLAGLLASSVFEFFQNVALFGFLLLFIGGLTRLLWAQRIFAKTRKKLTGLVSQEYILAVMLRLTDREIIRFSKMGSDEIATYAKKMSKIQMRWKQITGTYFAQNQ
jgi:hypothetical protein